MRPWLAPLLAFEVACLTVELKDAPKVDSGHHGACPSQPIIDCDAGAPDDDGCRPQADAGDARRAIPPGLYPVGCRVDFPDPIPLKATGECTLKAQCECVTGPLWKCLP
jgi:hypothetical protein